LGTNLCKKCDPNYFGVGRDFFLLFHQVARGSERLFVEMCRGFFQPCFADTIYLVGFVINSISSPDTANSNQRFVAEVEAIELLIQLIDGWFVRYSRPCLIEARK
jgi:hypothetical protein